MHDTTTPTDRDLTIASIVVRTLPFDRVPDWPAYRQAARAVQDTIEHVADEPLQPDGGAR